MKTQRKKGFTMVELVIVIAVIAILAAVLIPTFLNLTKKADEASALADARNAASMLLANFLKGGDEAEDIVIFTERSGKVYIYGYHAETGSILHYKNNPLDRKESTLADDVKAFVEQLCGEGALQPKGEEYPVDDWRTDEKMSEALSAAGFNADTMIAFATYELIPSRFSELTPEPTEPSIPTESKNPTDPTEKPTDPVHTHTLKHLPATSATCTQPGVAECWVCETCGKMFGDAEAKNEITQRIITESALGHDWDEIEAVAPEHENDEDGTKAGRKCNNCGLVEGCAVIPAHTFGPDHICTEPTCQKYEGAVTVKSENEFLEVVSEAYYDGKTAAIRLGNNVTLSQTEYNSIDFSNIVDLDLNGKTLTANYGFDLSYYFLNEDWDTADARLTVRRGTINYTAPEKDGASLSKVTPLFQLSYSAELSLKNVTVDADMNRVSSSIRQNSPYNVKSYSGSVIYIECASGSSVKVNVDASTITSAGHCIATRDPYGWSKNKTFNNIIELKNSKLITKYCGEKGAATGGKTNMAIYMSQPGTLLIENCQIAGERNAVFLRCGTATIKNSVLVRPYKVSEFTLDNTNYDTYYEQLVGLSDADYVLGNQKDVKWGSAEGGKLRAPLATLAVGSKLAEEGKGGPIDAKYGAAAECELVNTKVYAPCDETETVNVAYILNLNDENGYELEKKYTINDLNISLEFAKVVDSNTGNKAAGGKVIYICGNDTYKATLNYDANCSFGNIIAQGEYYYTVTGPKSN